MSNNQSYVYRKEKDVYVVASQIIEEIQVYKGVTRKKQLEEAAEKLKPLFQKFIQENPQLTGIRWTQYTPYFNDGDTCEFRINEPRFQFEGDDEGGDYDDGFYDLPFDYNREWAEDFRKVCTPELYVKCNEFASALSQIDDCLYTMFGDHCQVTITKDGVDVEEYDHD